MFGEWKGKKSKKAQAKKSYRLAELNFLRGCEGGET